MSLDELFGRIDADNDQSVTIDDYLKRDKYYVESVKNEFNQIDANRKFFHYFLMHAYTLIRIQRTTKWQSKNSMPT